MFLDLLQALNQARNNIQMDYTTYMISLTYKHQYQHQEFDHSQRLFFHILHILYQDREASFCIQCEFNFPTSYSRQTRAYCVYTDSEEIIMYVNSLDFRFSSIQSFWEFFSSVLIFKDDTLHTSIYGVTKSILYDCAEAEEL